MTLLPLLAACAATPDTSAGSDSAAQAVCPAGATGGGFDIGDCAPDFTEPDRNGDPVSLSDFRGKVALVDISAVW